MCNFCVKVIIVRVLSMGHGTQCKLYVVLGALKCNSPQYSILKSTRCSQELVFEYSWFLNSIKAFYFSHPPLNGICSRSRENRVLRITLTENRVEFDARICFRFSPLAGTERTKTIRVQFRHIQISGLVCGRCGIVTRC